MLTTVGNKDQGKISNHSNRLRRRVNLQSALTLLSLPKAQSGVTTPRGCDTGTRDVRVPDQASSGGPISDALAGETQG